MSYNGSKAIIGRGTQIAIGPVQGSSDPTYVKIGETADLSPTGREFDGIDVTNFDSDVDKEYIKGLRSPGKFDVKGNRVASDAGQAALEAAFESPSAFMFLVTFPVAQGQTNPETWAFSALVLSVDPPAISPDKTIQFGMMLQVTGPRTITAGS